MQFFKYITKQPINQRNRKDDQKGKKKKNNKAYYDFFKNVVHLSILLLYKKRHWRHDHRWLFQSLHCCGGMRFSYLCLTWAIINNTVWTQWTLEKVEGNFENWCLYIFLICIHLNKQLMEAGKRINPLCNTYYFHRNRNVFSWKRNQKAWWNICVYRF